MLEEGKSEIFFANIDGVCSWVVVVAEEKRGWEFDRVLELVVVVVVVVVTEKYDDECDECWRRGENAEK